LEPKTKWWAVGERLLLTRSGHGPLFVISLVVDHLLKTIRIVLAGARMLSVVSLVLIGQSARALELENGGFERDISSESSAGWEVISNGQTVDRDFQIKGEGTASLRVRSSSPRSSTMARQEVPSALVRTDAVRFSGLIRTDGIQGTATLFVVVRDKTARIFVDDMRDRPAQGDTGWTAVDIRIPKLLDAESVELGILMIGSGTAWFDALELVPIELGESTSDVARSYLRNALDIIEQRSIYGSETDWPALREQVDAIAAGSRSTEDTYPAVRFALGKLGDNHSSLFTPQRARELTTAGPDSTNLPRWEPASGTILDGRVGYVVVPSFEGTDPARMTQYVDELHALIARLDSESLCGWIVDLRRNHGGNVFAMLAGIGPILGEGDAGGGIAADGTDVVRSYHMGRSGRATASGKGYTLLKPMPPVAVLLGPDTASSGEALALGFVGRPATTTLGQPSAGKTSGNVPIPLEDGAILNLAATRMMDRDGNAYSGPISPDVRVVDNGSTEPAKNTVVREALNWLSSRQVCE
jgi:hypothetical protein